MNKKIIYLVLSLFLLGSVIETKAQYSWNFTTGLDGWTMAHSLTGVDSLGYMDTTAYLNITTTGSNPYMISPGNLAMDAKTYKTVKFNCLNSTNQNAFRIFFITNADQTWGTNGKMISIGVDANSTKYKEYKYDFTSITSWQGTIKQIRIDVGSPATGSTLSFNYIKITTDSFTLTLNNGIIKVGTNLLKGGAISYISKATDNYNIVNTSDNGRYIQQSYYAGQSLNRKAQGQSSSWSPWNWNPVQAGDAFYHSPIILANSQTDSTIYTKVQPMLWDMNNEVSQSYMETWLSLRGNTIHVKNTLTCFRTDTLWKALARDQELPAVYVIGDLFNLYTYTGTKPWTSAAADTIKNAGPPWRYWTSPEKWAAFLNTSNWGLGVYNATTTNFVGGFNGSAGGSTSTTSTGYIAPISIATLNKNTVYTYEYDLIVGTLAQIRSFVYKANNFTLPVTITNFKVKANDGFNMLTWDFEGEDDDVTFEIQKSNDGITFNSCGLVSSFTQKTAYTFTDNQLNTGRVFYRIMIVRKAGNREYSTIVIADESSLINPTLLSSGNGVAKFKLNNKFSGTIRLIDIYGHIIQAKSFGEITPITNFIMDYRAKGYYILHLIDNKNHTKTLKLFLN